MFKSQSYLDSWKEEGAQIQLMGLGTVHSGQEKLTDLVGGRVLWDNTKHWFIDFTTEFILGIYVLGVHTFLQIGKLKTILKKKSSLGYCIMDMVTQWQRIHLPMQEMWFDLLPVVRKISLRRK